jgi:hypothetical protein
MKKGRTLHLTGMAFAVTAQELGNVLQERDVPRCIVYWSNPNYRRTPMGTGPRIHDGWVHLEFQSAQDARTALHRLDQVQISYRSVRVSLATPKWARYSSGRDLDNVCFPTFAFQNRSKLLTP